MFAGGRTIREIAEARGNRTTSVRKAIYRIQEKLALISIEELVIWAVQNRIVDDNVLDG